MTRHGDGKQHDLRDLLRARHLAEPPRGTLSRAIALGEHLTRRATAAGAVRDWLVSLVFDSALEPMPAGVRSGGSAERRLLFEARIGEDGEAHQVDLRLRRTAEGTFDVTGQCLPPFPFALVEAGAGRGRRRAELGEGGEFLLRGVPGRGSSVKLAFRVDGGEDLELLEVPLPESPGRQ